ncbi:MAG: FKBP-type peptidyl-prolyl cis-trans isomerase [Bacteroidales bacterium]|nr:FKBP-type peptidyl-prolyl cis-trans isomerase [Bacteroidales bacterium]
MKKMLLFAAIVAIISSACSNNTIKSGKLSTKEDSLAYAFGVSTFFAMQLDSFEIDPKLMAKGMIDSKEGKNIMDDNAARGFIMVYFEEKQQAEMEAMYKDVREEGQKFLEENKTKEGIITTESGLQYQVITMGTGPKPTADNVVKVHYHGTLLDGQVFDSSVERGEPIDLPVTGVIPGWVEALQLMPVGSKFKLYIPYELAYGASGAGGVIPPFAALIFDVELIEIVNQ